MFYWEILGDWGSHGYYFDIYRVSNGSYAAPLTSGTPWWQQSPTAGQFTPPHSKIGSRITREVWQRTESSLDPASKLPTSQSDQASTWTSPVHGVPIPHSTGLKALAAHVLTGHQRLQPDLAAWGRPLKERSFYWSWGKAILKHI